MKKLILLSAALTVMALSASPAEAFGLRRHRGCEPSCQPCPQYTMVYEDRVVTCYKAVWKERDVPYTFRKPVFKDVVDKVKVKECVPEYKDEKRTVNYVTRVTKEVEREVTRCVRVVECCYDPCTCRTHRVVHRVPVTEKVKVCVVECVPQQKEITVKVCTMKTVEREVDVKRRICEFETVNAVRKERYCETVPYQVTVRVARCVPVTAAKVEHQHPTK